MKWNDRIGRRLKLNDLHVLLTVVETGSMGKAAERLAVSQPSVSKSIADLEHVTGVRLLDRSPRGVECTDYGRALLRRGLGAFDELRLAIKDIETLNDPASGEVRIGAPDSMASGFLTEVIERFSRQYPRVVVSVVPAENMAHEFRQLRDRNVDFLLGALDTPFMVEDLDAEPLFAQRFFIVAGGDSKWARRRKIELAELVDEPWLTGSRGLPPSRLVEAFHTAGLPPPSAGVRTYSTHERLRLLATNRFIGAEPAQVLQFCARPFSIKILPCVLPIRPWQVGIVTLKNRTISPVVQNFLSYARDVAKLVVANK